MNDPILAAIRVAIDESIYLSLGDVTQQATGVKGYEGNITHFLLRAAFLLVSAADAVARYDISGYPEEKIADAERMIEYAKAERNQQLHTPVQGGGGTEPIEPDYDDCPDGYGDSIDASLAEEEMRNYIAQDEIDRYEGGFSR